MNLNSIECHDNTLGLTRGCTCGHDNSSPWLRSETGARTIGTSIGSGLHLLSRLGHFSHFRLNFLSGNIPCCHGWLVTLALFVSHIL